MSFHHMAFRLSLEHHLNDFARVAAGLPELGEHLGLLSKEVLKLVPCPLNGVLNGGGEGLEGAVRYILLRWVLLCGGERGYEQN